MYKSSQQQEIENSPRFIVNHWRNIPEQEESALDSFLVWLKYDCESFNAENLDEITRLVNEYLGRENIAKIVRSEQALLDAWTLAAKG